MSKKNLVILVGAAALIAVLIVVAIFFFRRREGIMPALNILQTGSVEEKEKGDILIRNLSFQPTRFEAIKGQPVIWENLDKEIHTVTSNVFGGQHILRPGEKFTLETSNLPFGGEIIYKCDLHSKMVGVVALKPEKPSNAFQKFYSSLSQAKKDCISQALGSRLEGFLDETIAIPTQDEQRAIEACSR